MISTDKPAKFEVPGFDRHWEHIFTELTLLKMISTSVHLLWDRNIPKPTIFKWKDEQTTERNLRQ